MGDKERNGYVKYRRYGRDDLFDKTRVFTRAEFPETHISAYAENYIIAKGRIEDEIIFYIDNGTKGGRRCDPRLEDSEPRILSARQKRGSSSTIRPTFCGREEPESYSAYDAEPPYYTAAQQ